MTIRRRGFTLIELLVVVAIIGIIVAVSLVNYINALHKARQKRTMADMREIALGVAAYSIDLQQFPPAAASALPSGLSFPTKTIVNASAYIQPTYIEHCPVTDGWNSWFQYNTNGSDYVIRSTGADGVPDPSPPMCPTTAFNDDIIFVDGQFYQWPEGAQQ